MPSFDLNLPHRGPEPDLVIGQRDFMDCHDLHGISHRGKDFIAYLQEVDDVQPLGDWSCRIARRDFDAYAFELMQDRQLVVCACYDRGDHLEFAQLTREPA